MTQSNIQENCNYRVCVKAIIRNTEWKILITYEKRKGLWDFPWWWLEHKQNIQQWLRQELNEELWISSQSIEISPQPLYSRPCIFDNWYCLFLIAYSVNIPLSAILHTEENEDRKFVTKKELQTMELYTKLDNINQIFI